MKMLAHFIPIHVVIQIKLQKCKQFETKSKNLHYSI